jgi:hypothetical protein
MRTLAARSSAGRWLTASDFGAARKRELRRNLVAIGAFTFAAGVKGAIAASPGCEGAQRLHRPTPGEAQMDELFAVVASSALYLAFVAHCEARDALARTSPRLAWVGGLCAAVLVWGVSVAAYLTLAADSG